MLLHDLRYSLRLLRHRPTFTITAVLTLALGIGATTAAVTVVNGMLIRPLPFADPARLVVIRGSLPDLQDIAAGAQSLASAGFWASNRYNLRRGGETRQVLGGQISPELLPTLGVAPALGRGFDAGDDRADTVVLSDGLWRTEFGADPGVLGQAVTLGGSAYTIIGVMPASFRFPNADFVLWTSLDGALRQTPETARNRALRIFGLVGRLGPGATAAGLQSEADVIADRLARAYPDTNAGVQPAVRDLREQLVGNNRTALAALLASVGLLLLIACANVANLMLARTTTREAELAIRLALGAGRWRLVRQIGIEALVLAAAGGLLAMLLTLWSSDLMTSLLQNRLPRPDALTIDARVIGCALLASLLSAVLFSAGPALHAAGQSRVDFGPARGGSATRRARTIRRTVTVAEIGLAVIVIVGAGLLTRSYRALLERDNGLTVANLLTFNLVLVDVKDPVARTALLEQVRDRLARLPGVQRVGGATGFPLVTPQRGTRFAVDGRALGPSEDGALLISATPQYFASLHTPMLAGREFDEHDRDGQAPVVVINRALAAAIFGTTDPIGRRIKLVNPEHGDQWRDIVGVAGDLNYRGAGEEILPTIYTPFAQEPAFWSYMMVRTTSPPELIARDVGRAVAAVDPRLQAAAVRSMDAVMAESVNAPRLTMLLTVGLALVALGLAAVGIYGLIAYSVTQRTREIGIRMALGATVRDILTLVLTEGLALSAAGVALGLTAATLVMSAASALLFGVTARDPVTYAAAAAVLLVVGAGASLIPSRSAAQIEPATALRAD